MTVKTLIASALLGSSLLLASHAQTPPKERMQTEIESERLRVQNDGEKAYFLFSDGVVLRATNMLVECDSLEVFATREAEQQSNIGKFGAIQKIVATGNVRIVQQERVALCDRAVVQPNEERIVLTGSPAIVEQTGGTISSEEIVLNRADGRITFEGSANRKIRLTGPAIGDLGFEQTLPVPSAEDQPEGEDAEPASDTPEKDGTQPTETPDSE